MKRNVAAGIYTLIFVGIFLLMIGLVYYAMTNKFDVSEFVTGEITDLTYKAKTIELEFFTKNRNYIKTTVRQSPANSISRPYIGKKVQIRYLKDNPLDAKWHDGVGMYIILSFMLCFITPFFFAAICSIIGEGNPGYKLMLTGVRLGFIGLGIVFIFMGYYASKENQEYEANHIGTEFQKSTGTIIGFVTKTCEDSDDNEYTCYRYKVKYQTLEGTEFTSVVGRAKRKKDETKIGEPFDVMYRLQEPEYAVVYKKLNPNRPQIIKDWLPLIILGIIGFIIVLVGVFTKDFKLKVK